MYHHKLRLKPPALCTFSCYIVSIEGSVEVLGHLVTHSSITSLLFAPDFHLAMVCADKFRLHFGRRVTMMASARIENIQIYIKEACVC
jgi:hypothetical protein